MANFATVKAGIKGILEADSDLANGEVFDYEPNLSTVTKDPFAVVVPSGNEAEFFSTSENLRRHAFTIRIFVDVQRGESQAESLLTSIVDRLLDAFDTDYTLGGVSGIHMTTAAPSAWSYLLSDKTYRVAEIRLSTVTTVDIT